MKRKRLFIDFDGCISSYKNGWQGYHICNDSPWHSPEEATNSLDYLKSYCAHFEVVILSGRAATWRGRRCIRRWLKKWSSDWQWEVFKKIKITCKKKGDYVYYIDDRGWHFDGHFNSWPSVKTIEEFRPWSKKEKLNGQA